MSFGGTGLGVSWGKVGRMMSSDLMDGAGWMLSRVAELEGEEGFISLDELALDMLEVLDGGKTMS